MTTENLAGTAPPSDGSPNAAGEESRLHVRLLTALIVLVIGIPSILILGPLGAAGTPADVLGLATLVLWGLLRITEFRTRRRLNPVRFAMALFVVSILISYVAAAVRPINHLEINAADRGVLSTLAWLGILLLAVEGPQGVAQVDVVMRRLTIAGAAEASLGIVQHFTHLALVNYLTIPGLRANASLAQTLGSRAGYARPAGTAIHSIEFGAVLTMILPIALHYALYDRGRRPLARWLPVALIAFAVPISISRTAILSAAVALIFLLPTWPKAWRRTGYVAITGLLGCVYLAVPGLLGTLQSLFTDIGNDSSAASRTASYALADDFIGRAPWFGRGFGTFLPAYRILDNQLLGIAVQTGLVGLAALLTVMIVPIIAGMTLRRRLTEPVDRHRVQALVAAVAAAGASFAFYDALSFPMAAIVFFLLAGLVGCLWRLERDEPEPARTSALS